MKNKTVKKLKKQGKKIAKKVMNDPLSREYFEKQKKLTKETFRKVAKRIENKIDKILK